jgi:hypothetical protein
MSLSQRAQAYLATLRRGAFVPLDRVVDALKQAQYPTFDAWLEFHARYAGYEEHLGNDMAVWGIVHEHPYWLGPMEVLAEREDSKWRVTCAEVHPSYDYWLSSDGEFSSCGGGGRCESFDLKIERDALVHEAFAENRSWEFSPDLVEAAGSVRALCRLVGASVVPEASDKYATSWRAPDVIVIEDRLATADEQPASVWVATDAQATVLRHLRGKS